MRPVNTDPDFTHDYSAYSNGRCRCPVCTDAHRQYAWQARQRRADRLRQDPSLTSHGSISTYTNWICRCPRCTTAASAFKADRR